MRGDLINMSITAIIKKSFKTVVDNPFITLLLVLFLIGFNILIAHIFIVKSLTIMTVLTLCTFALFVCFLSGWFGVIKEACNDSKDKNYSAIFFENIGKNIIPTVIAILVYCFLFLVIIYSTSLIATKVFGSLEPIIANFSDNIQDNAKFLEYIQNLPLEQKYKIYSWQLSLIVACGGFNFLFMFYFPSIFFNEKSNIPSKAFISFFNSVIFLFKNFFGSLLIFFIICSTYSLIGVLKLIALSNMFLTMLLLIVSIYFIAVSIMVIFNYYHERNNCNNRTDGVGEDKSCDKSCEEN